MSFGIKAASAGAPMSGKLARLQSNGSKSNMSRKVTAAQRASSARQGGRAGKAPKK